MTKQTTRRRPRQSNKKLTLLSRQQRAALHYLPLAILVVLNLSVAGWQPTKPSRAVLAYATSVSISDLLANTNQQRAANGVASLSLNSKLDQAAQAKANDMVARDYWSHNTPDGQPPWVFFQNAGYAYQRAGENLAYGFNTAASTITGWMNSPPHKANLLDAGFRDVGFGFANSPNYVGDGEQTVVVSMYGTPAGSASAPPPASPPPVKSVAPVTAPTPTPPAPTPAPAAETPPAATNPKPDSAPITPVSDNSAASQAAATKQISQFQLLTRSAASWSTPVLIAGSISVVLLWALHHLRLLKRAMLVSEHFMLHHISIDLTVLAFASLLYLLSRSAGFIR